MISMTTLSIIMLVAFLVLIFLGVPIYICMMACGVVGCAIVLQDFEASASFLSSAFMSTFTSYTVSVAPMFMLMGEIASESGLGGNMFTSCRKILGRIPASLASSVQVACAVFGAVCGSAVATSGLMSRVAIPEMQKHGYKDELSAGSVGAGASLSTLIPPSLPLITYGASVQCSIGQLFMGGIFTGITLMLIFILIIQIWYIVDKKVAPKGEKYSFKAKLKALREGNIIDVIVVFGISFLGMFTGWFTPTEAGCIGTLLMLIVVIINKKFSFKMMATAAVNALMLGGMMYCLLAGTNVFGKFFTLTGMSGMISDWVTAMDLSGFAFIAILTVIFTIAGCFMDAMAVVLVTAPLFLPILNQFGYNEIWYGCYAVMITGLGAITPPVGMGAYVISGITKIDLQTCFKGCAPFILAFLLMAVVMTVFPEVAMWLPNMLYTS